MSKKQWAGLTTSLVLGVLWLTLLRPPFLGGPASYIVISGTSMEPGMHTGDIVIVHQHDDYEVGDVVAFRTDVGKVVIHRIVGGNATDGFVLQGDNREHTDDWHPTPDDILGSQWLHIPGAGDRVLWLTDPEHMGLVLAALAALPMLGGVEVKPGQSRHRARRRGRPMQQQNGNEPGSGGLGQWWPGSHSMLAGLIAAAALGVVFLGIGVLAMRTAPERTEYVEQFAYTHHATFDYAVQTERSTLYPDGRLVPIEQEDGTAAPAQPIFTQLAREMTVDFTYELESPLPPTVTGEIAADLVIRAGDGWTHTEPLMPPTPFEGGTADGHFSIDLAAIGALITRIEEETGFAPPTYTLSVEPRVTLAGNLGAHQIDEQYATAYAIEYDDTRIVPGTTLGMTEPVSIGGDVRFANEISVLGLRQPVDTWRWVGVFGTVASLLAGGVIAAIVYLGLGQDELAQVQARYRSMLMPVESDGREPAGTTIHVNSMRDLARLAQRDGGIIFHESRPYLHRYYVKDGEDTYDYTIHTFRDDSGETRESRPVPHLGDARH